VPDAKRHRPVQRPAAPAATGRSEVCAPNNLYRGLAATVGGSKRTCELTSSPVPRGTSVHRLVELEFPPIAFDSERPHAAAASLVHLNSVPSVQMRCIITAKRRASATIAFFIPRCYAEDLICLTKIKVLSSHQSLSFFGGNRAGNSRLFRHATRMGHRIGLSDQRRCVGGSDAHKGRLHPQRWRYQRRGQAVGPFYSTHILGRCDAQRRSLIAPRKVPGA
jgi:hypothetical protein